MTRMFTFEDVHIRGILAHVKRFILVGRKEFAFTYGVATKKNKLAIIANNLATIEKYFFFIQLAILKSVTKLLLYVAFCRITYSILDKIILSLSVQKKSSFSCQIIDQTTQKSPICKFILGLVDYVTPESPNILLQIGHGTGLPCPQLSRLNYFYFAFDSFENLVTLFKRRSHILGDS
ncbi:hypothetical protein BpHYR1_017519 [Brachionus plicatilis]|uniref:Uncharacterized protein n=1 Tax=Brachionus plicatilis TaxID=10195 RepID=A0A3M7T477_BRAPC|nr:hypothetical protein BpHYR1_017519 [Brachionus plicatilis]